MSELTYLKNVTTLELDPDKCNGCKICTLVCPHNVFEIIDRKAVIKDRDACMECGACALNCSEEAIKVDSGVGCATGIIIGALKGSEPTCGCCCEDS